MNYSISYYDMNPVIQLREHQLKLAQETSKKTLTELGKDLDLQQGEKMMELLSRSSPTRIPNAPVEAARNGAYVISINGSYDELPVPKSAPREEYYDVPLENLPKRGRMRGRGGHTRGRGRGRGRGRITYHNPKFYGMANNGEAQHNFVPMSLANFDPRRDFTLRV